MKYFTSRDLLNISLLHNVFLKIFDWRFIMLVLRNWRNLYITVKILKHILIRIICGLKKGKKKYDVTFAFFQNWLHTLKYSVLCLDNWCMMQQFLFCAVKLLLLKCATTIICKKYMAKLIWYQNYVYILININHL